MREVGDLEGWAGGLCCSFWLGFAVRGLGRREWAVVVDDLGTSRCQMGQIEGGKSEVKIRSEVQEVM